MSVDRVVVCGLASGPAGEVRPHAAGRRRGRLELGVVGHGLLDRGVDLLREALVGRVEVGDRAEERPAVGEGVGVGAVLRRAPVHRQLHGRLPVRGRRLLDLRGERGRVGRRVLVVLDQAEGLPEFLHDLRAGLVGGGLLRGRARLRGLAVRRLQLLLEPGNRRGRVVVGRLLRGRLGLGLLALVLVVRAAARLGVVGLVVVGIAAVVSVAAVVGAGVASVPAVCVQPRVERAGGVGVGPSGAREGVAGEVLLLHRALLVRVGSPAPGGAVERSGPHPAGGSRCQRRALHSPDDR
ncbi:putative phage minor structural protein [Streptomyces sp. Tu6071]|nr:putative phage minor structural protein [Streptomyces sp. Tu6071]